MVAHSISFGIRFAHSSRLLGALVAFQPVASPQYTNARSSFTSLIRHRYSLRWCRSLTTGLIFVRYCSRMTRLEFHNVLHFHRFSHKHWYFFGKKRCRKYASTKSESHFWEQFTLADSVLTFSKNAQKIGQYIILQSKKLLSEKFSMKLLKSEEYIFFCKLDNF